MGCVVTDAPVHSKTDKTIRACPSLLATWRVHAQSFKG